jgi:uncharacterized protein YbaP (TraB family)
MDMRMKGAGRLVPALLLLGALALPAESVSAERHCLWKVESEGHTLYLLGSIHFLTEDAYPLDQAIEEIFQRVDGLVFETDLDTLEAAATQMKLMKKGMYGEGESLRENVSAETYQALQERVESYGQSMILYDRFRPWFLTAMLSALELQKQGFQPEHGIDVHFHARAKEAGKEIVGLEGVEFQIDLFAGIPEERQEALLQYTLHELDLTADYLDIIVDSWREGDVVTLDTTFVRMMVGEEAWADLSDRLVFDRNRDWVPKIEDLMRSGKEYLVVVGTLHLVGEGSVVDLIRRKGYAVEQM